MEPQIAPNSGIRSTMDTASGTPQNSPGLSRALRSYGSSTGFSHSSMASSSPMSGVTYPQQVDNASVDEPAHSRAITVKLVTA